MNITFPGGRFTFDVSRSAVTFQAIVDNDSHVVIVSTEALADVYGLRGGGAEGAINCYVQNITSIHLIAERLIRNGQMKEDGSYLITSEIASSR